MPKLKHLHSGEKLVSPRNSGNWDVRPVIAPDGPWPDRIVTYALGWHNCPPSPLHSVPPAFITYVSYVDALPTTWWMVDGGWLKDDEWMVSMVDQWFIHQESWTTNDDITVPSWCMCFNHHQPSSSSCASPPRYRVAESQSRRVQPDRSWLLIPHVDRWNAKSKSESKKNMVIAIISSGIGSIARHRTASVIDSLNTCRVWMDRCAVSLTGPSGGRVLPNSARIRKRHSTFSCSVRNSFSLLPLAELLQPHHNGKLLPWSAMTKVTHVTSDPIDNRQSWWWIGVQRMKHAASLLNQKSRLGTQKRKIVQRLAPEKAMAIYILERVHLDPAFFFLGARTKPDRVVRRRSDASRHTIIPYSVTPLRCVHQSRLDASSEHVGEAFWPLRCRLWLRGEVELYTVVFVSLLFSLFEIFNGSLLVEAFILISSQAWKATAPSYLPGLGNRKMSCHACLRRNSGWPWIFCTEHVLWDPPIFLTSHLVLIMFLRLNTQRLWVDNLSSAIIISSSPAW